MLYCQAKAGTYILNKIQSSEAETNKSRDFHFTHHHSFSCIFAQFRERIWLENKWMWKKSTAKELLLRLHVTCIKRLVIYYASRKDTLNSSVPCLPYKKTSILFVNNNYCLRQYQLAFLLWRFCSFTIHTFWLFVFVGRVGVFKHNMLQARSLIYCEMSTLLYGTLDDTFGAHSSFYVIHSFCFFRCSLFWPFCLQFSKVVFCKSLYPSASGVIFF